MTGLGESDSVESGVELSSAGSVEAVANVVRRPDWNRRGAIVAGEGVLGPEALSPSRLADNLGR
jgi:hypothetical protein